MSLTTVIPQAWNKAWRNRREKAKPELYTPLRIPRGDAPAFPVHPDRPRPGSAGAGDGHGLTPLAGGQRPASRPGRGERRPPYQPGKHTPSSRFQPRQRPAWSLPGPFFGGEVRQAPSRPPVPVPFRHPPSPPPATAGLGRPRAAPYPSARPLPDGTGLTDAGLTEPGRRLGAALPSLSSRLLSPPARPPASLTAAPRRRSPLPPQLFTVSSAPSPPLAPCRLCPWLQLGWAAALIRTAESPSRLLHGARFPRRAPAHTQSGAGPARSYHGNRPRLRHGRGRGGAGRREEEREGRAGGGEGSSGTEAGRAQTAPNAFARAAAGGRARSPRPAPPCPAAGGGGAAGRVPAARKHAGVRLLREIFRRERGAGPGYPLCPRPSRGRRRVRAAGALRGPVPSEVLSGRQCPWNYPERWRERKQIIICDLFRGRKLKVAPKRPERRAGLRGGGSRAGPGRAGRSCRPFGRPAQPQPQPQRLESISVRAGSLPLQEGNS